MRGGIRRTIAPWLQTPRDAGYMRARRNVGGALRALNFRSTSTSYRGRPATLQLTQWRTRRAEVAAAPLSGLISAGL